jgi:Mg-chelatase subunit ChlD
MTLMNPWLVLGALLGVVPVLIHLVARRRYRTIRWAATDLLARAVDRQQRRIGRADRLLLAVRVLVLVLVSLCLARPVLISAKVQAGQAGAVILVDVSGSMQTPAGSQSRLMAAKDRARELLGVLPAGTAVGVIGVDDRAVPMTTGPVADRTQILTGLDRLKAGARSTDLTPALSLAVKWLEECSATSRTIYLITDAQENVFTRDAAAVRAFLRQSPAGVEFVILPVATTGGLNAAITDVYIRRPGSVTGQPAVIQVQVETMGDSSASHSLGVELWLDGRKADRREVEVAGGVANVVFQPLVGKVGLHVVEARLDSDACELDNHRFAAFHVPAGMDVVIVADPPARGGAPSGYAYLKAALEALADVGVPWTVRPPLTPAELARALDGQVWLLILADCGALPSEAVQRMGVYLDQGGACWLAGSRRLGETLASFHASGSRASAFLEILRIGRAQSQSDPDGQALHIDPNSARGTLPLDLRADGVRAALETVRLFDVRSAVPATDSRWSVALRTETGQPLLLTHASRRIALLTTALDATGSDWPYRPAFVTLVDGISRWLCQHKMVSGSSTPGRKWAGPSAPSDGAYMVLAPDGTTVPVPEGEGCVLETPGVYTRFGADRSAEDIDDARTAVAVNIDPRECRGPAWSSEQIAAWLPPGHGRAIGPDKRVEPPAQTAGAHRELWPILAGLLLVLLAAETLLAHWFTPEPTPATAAEVKA